MFLVYSELNDAFLNFLYIFSVNWQKKKNLCEIFCRGTVVGSWLPSCKTEFMNYFFSRNLADMKGVGVWGRLYRRLGHFLKKSKI